MSHPSHILLVLVVVLTFSSLSSAAVDEEEVYEYFVAPPESNDTVADLGNETDTGNETETEVGNETEPNPEPTQDPVSQLMGDSTTDCWDDNTVPHPICSCDDLNRMRTQALWEYELQNDIDFSACDVSYTTGEGWDPLDNDGSGSFRGSFYGNNHTITGLYINRPTENNVGLFGKAHGALITDLALESVNVTSDSQYVGGLAGDLTYSIILNSHVTGNVLGTFYHTGGFAGYMSYSTILNSYFSGNVTGDIIVGGFAGRIYHESLISNSYSTGTVTGNGTVGGFIGDTYYYSVIRDSYSTANVTGNEDKVGGFAGVLNHEAIILNSYSTGNVIGNIETGGFAGYMANEAILSNSYSTGNVTGTVTTGGLVGLLRSDATLIDSYWLNHTGDDAIDCHSAGNVNCTAEPLESYFFDYSNEPEASWDFTNIWNDSNDGVNYPILQSTILLCPNSMGGDGSLANPCIISSLFDLRNMVSRLDCNYSLSVDLDLNTPPFNYDYGWTPLGSEARPLNGNFDGANHTISNLYIDLPTSEYSGLFGVVNNSNINNLALLSADVTGGPNTGGLVGKLSSGTIQDSYLVGIISGNTSVGGLAGDLNEGTIQDSYVIALISGDSSVGGITGDLNGGTIRDSYAVGRVSGTSKVGGLAGDLNGGTITDSYASENISGTSNTGGITGDLNGGTITDSYWLNSSDDASSCYPGGNVGCSPEDNKTYFFEVANSPTDSWDFPPWDNFCDNVGYSPLEWEDVNDTADCRTDYPYIGCPEGISGAGSIEDPCLITNVSNLNALRMCPTCNYTLTADLDLDVAPYNAGEGWLPLCNSTTPFSGSFDGANHTIENLYINRPSTDANGLFAVIEYAAISNLGLNSVNINGKSDNGAITAKLGMNSSISNSYSTGSVTGAVFNTGGLIGSVSQSTISDSYSTANVTGLYFTGGLTGSLSTESTVSNSYSTGTIIGSYYTGGMAGRHISGTVNNSYSTGSVTGGSSTGGFIGNVYVGVIINNAYWLNHTGDDATECYSGGNENCTVKTDERYFFASTESPISNWSFPPWDSFCNGVGNQPLAWQDLTDLSNCPNYLPLTCPDNMFGAGTSSYPCQITNVSNLNASRLCLNCSYSLTTDLDLDIAPYNTGSGWLPIGNNSNQFRGNFEGNNNTITDLYINRPSERYMSFFGYINNSNISNLHLILIGLTGDIYTAGLAGAVYSSTISNSSVTGDIAGSGGSGGLTGYLENSAIKNSHVTGNLIGDAGSGGLSGYVMASTITNSYATGNITATNTIGVLAGYVVSSSIINSYAIGNITGTNSIGGLTGYLYLSSLTNTYAAVNVVGTNHLGGLSGYVRTSTVTNSYATGNVTGTSSLGGLTSSISGSTISNFYWLNHTDDNASSCYPGGNVNCTTIENVSYFFKAANTPISSWSFPPWDAFCENVGYQPLAWQNLTNETECPGYIAPNFTVDFRVSPRYISETGKSYWNLTVTNLVASSALLATITNPSGNDYNVSINPGEYYTHSWERGVSCPTRTLTQSVSVSSITPAPVTKSASATVSVSCSSSSCKKSWECDPWSACENGVQTRDCSCACSHNSDCTGDHDEKRACDLCGDVTCTDDNNPCTSTSCIDGVCITQLLSGSSCDDADPCTLNDYCKEGVCIPGEVSTDPACSECEFEWICGNWSDCEEGLKTRLCVCVCENNDCKGDSQMVDTCDPSADKGELEIVIKGGEFTGEDIKVTILDEAGNPVNGATIEFMAPNGQVFSYEKGTLLYDAGTWTVMAEKAGYAGNYIEFDVDTGDAVESSNTSKDISTGSDSTPLLVIIILIVIVAAVLILSFATKSKGFNIAKKT